MRIDFFRNIQKIYALKKVRRLLSAFAISNVGDRAFQAALPLYVLLEKSDVSSFSKILFFEAVPMLILSTIVAEIIAKYNKKRLMLICDAAQFLLVGSILVCQYEYYYYVVAFLMTTFGMINAGSCNVLYYNITPKEHYPILASVSSSVRNLTKISILPLTAFLLIYLAPYYFFLLNMLSYLMSFLIILTVNGKEGEVFEKPKKLIGIAKEYRKIFLLIRNDYILKTFIVCSIPIGIIFGIANFFFPIYLVDVLKDSIRNLPNYLVFEALGAILSGFFIINYVKRLNLVFISIVTLGSFSVLYLILYVFPLKVVVFGVFLLLGIALNVLIVSISTIIQSRIQNKDRVRISTLNQIIEQLSFLFPGAFLFISAIIPTDLIFLASSGIAAFAALFVLTSTWTNRKKEITYGD